MKHEFELWSTPVWQIETGLPREFNLELMKELHDFDGDDVWSHPSVKLHSLANIITSYAKDFAYTFKPSYLTNAQIDTRFKLGRGSVNIQKPGELFPVHNHPSEMLSVVYYISTPQDCGDLMMIDPRGGVNWAWQMENGISGIKHQRFKPIESSLIIFPAFVLHHVETNLSEKNRLSLATSISFN